MCIEPSHRVWLILSALAPQLHTFFVVKDASLASWLNNTLVFWLNMVGLLTFYTFNKENQFSLSIWPKKSLFEYFRRQLSYHITAPAVIIRAKFVNFVASLIYTRLAVCGCSVHDKEQAHKFGMGTDLRNQDQNQGKGFGN